jgi:hypothetical protein
MDKAVLTYADGTKVIALENDSLNTNKIIPLAMPFAGKLDHECGWETDYLTEHPGRYIFFALVSPCEDRVEDAFVYDREYQEEVDGLLGQADQGFCDGLYRAQGTPPFSAWLLTGSADDVSEAQSAEGTAEGLFLQHQQFFKKTG